MYCKVHNERKTGELTSPLPSDGSMVDNESLIGAGVVRSATIPAEYKFHTAILRDRSKSRRSTTESPPLRRTDMLCERPSSHHPIINLRVRRIVREREGDVTRPDGLYKDSQQFHANSLLRDVKLSADGVTYVRSTYSVHTTQRILRDMPRKKTMGQSRHWRLHGLLSRPS